MAQPTLPLGSGGPPTVGDWTITEQETYYDQEVLVRGNVTIKPGGTLTLVGATLKLELPLPFEPELIVEAGGRLHLNGTIDRPSRVTDGSLDNESNEFQAWTNYFIHIIGEQGSVIEGTQCVIEQTGYNQLNRNLPSYPGHLNDGFRIDGRLALKDCRIQDTFHGMRVTENATLELSNVRFANNSEGAFVTLGANLAKIHGIVGEDGWSIVNGGVFEASDFQHAGGGVGGSVGNDRAFGGAPSNGIIRNASWDDFIGCFSVYDGAIVRLLSSSLTNCGRALGVSDGSQVLMENGLIRGGGNVLSGGAVEIRNGSRVVFQNVTLQPDHGYSVYYRGQTSFTLRNVSWDESMHGKLEPGERFDLVREGGLDVLLQTEDGAPIEGAFIRLTAVATNQTLEATTDSRGSAFLWVPYDRQDPSQRFSGRWMDWTPTWTFRLDAGPFAYEKELTLSPQDNAVFLVWDGEALVEDPFLNLEPADPGRAPIHASEMGDGTAPPTVPPEHSPAAEPGSGPSSFQVRVLKAQTLAIILFGGLGLTLLAVMGLQLVKRRSG